MASPRSIQFTIAGSNGSPGVVVTLTEADGGAIRFDVALGGSGDLRGLFFDLADDAKLAGLAVNGAALSAFDTVDVINLGGGVNMNGAAQPFDVGMAFSSGPAKLLATSFTLTNAAGNLTLDDFSHMDFGARLSGSAGKLVASIPAAPDARADHYEIFEDGASGLNGGAEPAKGIVFQVLGNDTDADGQALTITQVEGAAHGTLTIVDGDDADTLAGDAVLYVADADYAGTDSFVYSVSDGHGGTDSATVTVGITAVADAPTLDVQVLAGQSANETRFIVTASHADADGSEFMDRLQASGLPPGATLTPGDVNPGGTPGTLVQEFVLTLPPNTGASFDLSFSAVAKEMSNGDEQVATKTVRVEVQHDEHHLQQTFEADDQSIWSSGDAFKIEAHDFWGVDEQVSSKGSASGLFYDVAAGATFGIQQDISISGGEIDATMTYDINVDSTHNKTTDQLTIHTSAFASDASFHAMGPEGAYSLDLLYDFFFKVAAGIDIGLGEWNLLPGLEGELDLSQNIVDFSSYDASESFNPMPGLDLTVAWPHFNTFGGFDGSAQSSDLFSFAADVDEMLSGLAPNLFDIGVDLGVVWGNFELLDFDIAGSLAFLQSFHQASQGLTGKLVFEDGSVATLTMGQDLTLDNASLIDAAGDHDGKVEFKMELVPTVQLTNHTELVFDMSYSFDLLKFSGGYDVGFDSGTLDKGPAYHAGGDLIESSSVVYDESFQLKYVPVLLDFGG